MPVADYVPAAYTDAQLLAYTGITLRDAKTYTAVKAARADAQNFGAPTQNMLLKLRNIISTGGLGAVKVYNATGGTLAAGPVRLSGYNVANSAFTIVLADADANAPADLLLLSSLANATAGMAYVGGDFTSSLNTSALAVGDPVYLSDAGVVTQTALTGADQVLQRVGRVKTLAASGVIAGYIESPIKIGTTYLQDLSVATGKIAANAVTDAKLRQGLARTVIGVTGNATANVADIQGTTDQVLRVNTAGTALTFGTVATGGLTNNAVTYGKMQQVTARSVIGVTGNATADPAAIQGTADQVLRVNSGGSALEFGTVATAGIAANAVTDAKLRQGAAQTVIGRSANSTGDVADISLASAGKFLGSRASAIGAFYPRQVLNKDVNYSLVQDDYGALVVCNTTAARILTLPAPATVGAGWWVMVKKTSASTSFTQSIARNAAETIDGRSASDVLTAQYSYAIYMCDGTNWHVIAVSDYLSVAVTSGTNITTTDTYQDMASLSITPGEWDISLVVDFILNGATCTAAIGGVSVTSGNSGTGLNFGDNASMTLPPTAATDTSVSPGWRREVTATATYYAKVRATFSAGNPQFRCRLSARRVR